MLKRVLYLEREMNIMRHDFEEKMKLFAGHRGDELKKEYQMLISEYKMFKTKNVKNFRFNSAANFNTFGKSVLLANWPKISILQPALRALGLLLADGAPTVGGGKTFWRVN